MADTANTSQNDNEESEQDRVDRELDHLLGELRVAMPGVQVLFAFLLTVPFQQRFAQATEFQRDVYFVTLLAAAAASALFVAPTAVMTVALSSTLFVALWFVLGLVRRFSKETKDTT